MLAVLPTASPISSEPVCRIIVLAPAPVNDTEVPPSIVPAFLTVPEPWMAETPPVIVAPKAFVTSRMGALMPNAPPEIDPAKLLIVAVVCALTATPLTANAAIFPVLAVTLTVRR